MKAVLILIATTLALCEARAQSSYILLPKDSLTQPIISQFKGFDAYQQGQFMQDDTSTLGEHIFEQDTSKVYVILSWQGQAPSSVPDAYSSDSTSIERKIFTESQVQDYINLNQYVEESLLDD